MKLFASQGISDEPHTKGALSRVVIEMIKRECPQQLQVVLLALTGFVEWETQKCDIMADYYKCVYI